MNHLPHSQIPDRFNNMISHILWCLAIVIINSTIIVNDFVVVSGEILSVARPRKIVHHNSTASLAFTIIVSDAIVSATTIGVRDDRDRARTFHIYTVLFLHDFV